MKTTQLRACHTVFNKHKFLLVSQVFMEPQAEHEKGSIQFKKREKIHWLLLETKSKGREDSRNGSKLKISKISRNCDDDNNHN